MITTVSKTTVIFTWLRTKETGGRLATNIVLIDSDFFFHREVAEELSAVEAIQLDEIRRHSPSLKLEVNQSSTFPDLVSCLCQFPWG